MSLRLTRRGALALGALALVVPVAVEVPIRGARGTPRAVMFDDDVDDEKVPAPPLA